MTPAAKILWRDLWHLRGQVLAAALVVACGVAVQVAMRSAYVSLEAAKTNFYSSYRFADVFAPLKRAPESLADSIRRLPGVSQVNTRVVADVTLDVPGLAEPASGRLISIPEHPRPMLNDLFLRSGRYIEPGQPDEVLISEAFARANQLNVGSRIGAVLNGRWRDLTVVGVALSPEYIYEVGPGMIFPDNRRFGVLWMGRDALASAFSMQGAFNDVSLSLSHGADKQEVIARLNQALRRYGGLIAYGREDQLSNRFLSDELSEIRISSTFIPAIFLGVAVFLIYIVLSRLVVTQRTQIGLLKAFGYSHRTLGAHYLKFSLVTLAAGLVPGLFLGWYLGVKTAGLYADYFFFPRMSLVVTPGIILWAVLVNVAAACAGAISAVRRVAALAPAEAMRPESPARFRGGLTERWGAVRWLSSSTRMIVRNIARKPWKALISILGIGMAVGLMMVSRFIFDAVDHMVYVQFSLVQRDDVTVTFHDPRGSRAIYDLRQLPGVLRAEPFRAAAVRLRYGHRSKQVELTGLTPGGELRQIVDSHLQVLQLPSDGILITKKLGEILGVRPGDKVTMEVLEGARPVRDISVAGLSDEYIGIGAYMNAHALARMLGEDSVASGAFLSVDPHHAGALYARLKRMPAVSGVAVRGATIRSVNDAMQRSFLSVSLIEILFAAVIVGGMVYNSVRIALSERGTELASLRVLGFTQREVTALLLGEQALLTLCALPAGLAIGYGMCAGLVPVFNRELYRLPLVFSNMTFIYPVIATLVAAILSALLVARRIRRLDLIAVLKTRE
ncbi:MAG TPA: FtsX-like permease family protein [Gallionellaceae bacterium]|nr:FtsX-like permease family protein [Gallionellaceae bacterium]